MDTNTGYNGFTAVMCLLALTPGSVQTARILRELTVLEKKDVFLTYSFIQFISTG